MSGFTLPSKHGRGRVPVSRYEARARRLGGRALDLLATFRLDQPKHVEIPKQKRGLTKALRRLKLRGLVKKVGRDTYLLTIQGRARLMMLGRYPGDAIMKPKPAPPSPGDSRLLPARAVARSTRGSVSVSPSVQRTTARRDYRSRLFTIPESERTKRSPLRPLVCPPFPTRSRRKVHSEASVSELHGPVTLKHGRACDICDKPIQPGPAVRILMIIEGPFYGEEVFYCHEEVCAPAMIRELRARQRSGRKVP